MSLQEDVRTLASLPAFRDFEPDALRLIAFSAETRVMRAGDVLFREGETSDGGFLVLSGSVSLETGAGPALVVKPPALLGESALAAETIRPATATARAPSSVLKIPRAVYLRVLVEHPDTAVRVRRSLAARVLALQSELNEVRSSLVG